MKYRLLDLIACPACGGELHCNASEVSMPAGDCCEEVIEGELNCDQEHFYPIIKCIPRLLLPALLAETLRQFQPQHYQCYRGRLPAPAAGEAVLKKKTLRSFSYQWNVFSEMCKNAK